MSAESARAEGRESVPRLCRWNGFEERSGFFDSRFCTCPVDLVEHLLAFSLVRKKKRVGVPALDAFYEVAEGGRIPETGREGRE